MNQVTENPDTTDVLVSVIERAAKKDYVGMFYKTTSIRLPLIVGSQVEAYAAQAGTSNHLMMGYLVQVGLDECRKHFKPETLASIEKQTQAFIAKAVKGGSK